MKNERIDAVLTWMDGRDPVLREKRAPYITARHEDKFNDIAGNERFIAHDEIRYAVASILRFVPYVGRIFIVTPGQDPHLAQFLRTHFPQNDVPVIIIDQDTLFREEERHFLPVFHSLAVETVICRIPGLTEEFIYMNDDFFFTSPSRKEDLFRDGNVVCYTKVYHSQVWRILRFLRLRKNGHKRFTYKDSLLNGAQILGKRHFFLLPHEPHPILKSVLSGFLDGHPEIASRNLGHRFRDAESFNVQGLFYLLAEQQGKLVRKRPDSYQIIFRPRDGKKPYMKRKLLEIKRKKHLKFGCMNAYSNLTETDQALFRNWIEHLLFP